MQSNEHGIFHASCSSQRQREYLWFAGSSHPTRTLFSAARHSSSPIHTFAASPSPSPLGITSRKPTCLTVSPSHRLPYILHFTSLHSASLNPWLNNDGPSHTPTQTATPPTSKKVSNHGLPKRKRVLKKKLFPPYQVFEHLDFFPFSGSIE